MEHFSPDQKIAMLVVPVMLFGMLGMSYAPAYGRTTGEEEEVTVRRVDDERKGKSGNEDDEGVVPAEDNFQYTLVSQGEDGVRAERIKAALEEADLEAFSKAVAGTRFSEMASEPFFTELVHLYKLHISGAHTEANAHLSRLLYDA